MKQVLIHAGLDLRATWFTRYLIYAGLDLRGAGLLLLRCSS